VGYNFNIYKKQLPLNANEYIKCLTRFIVISLIWKEVLSIMLSRYNKCYSILTNFTGREVVAEVITLVLFCETNI